MKYVLKDIVMYGTGFIFAALWWYVSSSTFSGIIPFLFILAVLLALAVDLGSRLRTKRRETS